MAVHNRDLPLRVAEEFNALAEVLERALIPEPPTGGGTPVESPRLRLVVEHERRAA